MGEKRFTVAALDLGIKAMTPQLRWPSAASRCTSCPPARRCRPHDPSAHGLDGVFFSNGPGDPAAADHEVGVLREVLAAGIPFFGICFGNQLLGRALGFGTYKLKYGHRGINQPVMDRTTGKVEVTAHNHGFAVDAPLDRGHRHRVRHAPASRTSASTTTSSRASSCVLPQAISPPSRSSTTRRRQRDRTTRHTCSTGSSTSSTRPRR